MPGLGAPTWDLSYFGKAGESQIQVLSEIRTVVLVSLQNLAKPKMTKASEMAQQVKVLAMQARLP